MAPLLARAVAGALLASLAFGPLATPAALAQSQAGQGIAAIVNDEVISLHDLDSRMTLVLLTSNLPDTPENRKRLAPEVLRTLVDETLKRQEMRKQNITVPQAEIDRTLSQVAQQLRISPGDLPAFLAGHGVRMPVLIEQIEAELGWLKVVSRVAGDRGTVTEQEVDEEIARTRGTGGVEYRLAEIFLPVDDPADQGRVEELATRLVSEARSGANFSALARSFSQGPSASNGGDLGWVSREDVDSQIDAVVSQMQKGRVSDPIRAQGGYFILYLIDSRSGETAPGSRISMVLEQALVPLPRTAAPEDVQAAVQTIQNLSAGASSCDELASRGKDVDARITTTPGMIDTQQMPPDLRQLVTPLGAGGITQPIRTNEGVLVLMVCDRQEQQSAGEDRDAVERRLRDQRLAAVSRRQLRELRRSALMDVRM